MDRWIISFTQSLLLFVKAEMAAYRLYTVLPRFVFSLSKCGDSSVLIFLQFCYWFYLNPSASCVRPIHTLIQVRLIIIFIFQADEVHRQPHQLVRAHQPKASEGRVNDSGRFQTSSRHTLFCSGKLKKLFLTVKGFS